MRCANLPSIKNFQYIHTMTYRLHFIMNKEAILSNFKLSHPANKPKNINIPKTIRTEMTTFNSEPSQFKLIGTIRTSNSSTYSF